VSLTYTSVFCEKPMMGVRSRRKRIVFIPVWVKMFYD
jgi:hypothetical protein